VRPGVAVVNAVTYALGLAADNRLFQVRDARTDECEYRDDDNYPVDAAAVHVLISRGWIGEITRWEWHQPNLLRRRLDVSEGGLEAHLNGATS
jgi:hypothetical protein